MKIATPKVLHIGLLCLISTSIFSQEAIFAFAYNKEGKTVTLDSESSEFFSYKHATAESVLDNLIEAKGTFNMPRPQLIMNNAEQKPAWVDLNNAYVGLEEKAYDLCVSLGADSLAALSLLISHELIHYYEKHDWHNHFLKNYSQEMEAEIEEESLSLEIQADQMGGFLSQMAGYKTEGVYEKLLAKIYTAYKLNDLSTSHAYPSLAERIKLAVKAEEELVKMNLIFEMSNQLSLIGEYGLASDYLDYIMINCKFQSRELHNNKGILMAFSALPYFSKKEMPFAVPFEIDVESRLARKNVDVKKRNEYIDLAVQSFKTALLLDEKYVPAQINLASLQILNQEYFEAEYLCRKSLRQLDEKTQAHQVASVLNNLALIRVLQDDREQAIDYIDQSLSFNKGVINSYNKKMIMGESEDFLVEDKSKLSCIIDEVDLESLYSRIMQEDETASLAININKLTDFYLIEKETSSICINFLDWGDKGFSFFQKGNEVTIDGEDYTSGILYNDINSKLGEPDQVLSSSNKKLVNYKRHRLNLLVDSDGKIESYIVYKNKK